MAFLQKIFAQCDWFQGGSANEKNSFFKDAVDKQIGSQNALIEGNLWKLNEDGDATSDGDWLLRRFWLTQRGLLVYDSEKEGKPSALCAGNPVSYGRVWKCDPRTEGPSSKPYMIKVQFVPPGGKVTDYEPTTLALDTSEDRDEWMKALNRFPRRGG